MIKIYIPFLCHSFKSLVFRNLKNSFVYNINYVYETLERKYYSVKSNDRLLFKHFGNKDVFGELDDNRQFAPLKAEKEIKDDPDGYDKLEINLDRKSFKYSFNLTNAVHLSGTKKANLAKSLQLFNKMLEDRMIPKPHHFTLIITACADHGYTEKAFELFNLCQNYKCKITKAMVTSLINSCALCPFRDYGLEKLNYLRDWLNRNGFVYNTTHYNAMIKAYGMLRDFESAKNIVNEMVENQISTDKNTFISLLIGCCSDFERGFGEALKVFRRINYHKVEKNEPMYNILLRATRDCGIGSKEELEQLTQDWFKGENLKYFSHRLLPKISTSQELKNCKFLEKIEDKSVKPDIESKDKPAKTNLPSVYPNFLTTCFSTRSEEVTGIDYESLKNPENRLILIGGVNGFLDLMKDAKIKPTIKTFTLLLELIPNNKKAEDELIKLMINNSVNPDIGFFNMIIKRRNKRECLNETKDAIVQMQMFGLEPDIATYGVMANGCFDLDSAKNFMAEMKANGVSPNRIILTALLIQAVRKENFSYIKFIIELMDAKGFKCTKKDIEHIVALKDNMTNKLLLAEKGQLKLNKKFQTEEFSEEFRQFKIFFRKYLKKTKLEKEDHIWNQFKEYDRVNKHLDIQNIKKDMMKLIAERDDIKALKSNHNFKLKDLISGKLDEAVAEINE